MQKLLCLKNVCKSIFRHRRAEYLEIILQRIITKVV